MPERKRTRRITRQQFQHDVASWAARIGVTPKRVQIQRLTRKWASCSTAGRLTFSTDVLATAPDFRSEVIVHELLHLMIPNHGKLFRSLMKAHLGQSSRNGSSFTCSTQLEA